MQLQKVDKGWWLIENILTLIILEKHLVGRVSKRFTLYCFLRYYYDNEDVQNDHEFQRYLHELSIDSLPIFHGRYGKVSVKNLVAVFGFTYVQLFC